MYKMDNNKLYICKAFYGRDKFIKNPLCNSIYKRMFYNEDLSNNEILLFETLLELCKIHKSYDIKYTFERLSPLIRMTRRPFEKARKQLIDRKLISISRDGYKNPTVYTININYITSNFHEIYDLKKVSKDDLTDILENIKKWLTLNI